MKRLTMQGLLWRSIRSAAFPYGMPSEASPRRQHQVGRTVRMYAMGGEGKVAVVQGASGGLGLEFTRQLLQRPKQRVVATCRNPSRANELQTLAAQHPERLTLIPLDLTDEASINAAAEEAAAHVTHVNLLLNASGVLHIPGVMSPETALSRVTMENLRRNFEVNTFGPILVAKGFAPLLVKAADYGATSERPAVIASLSARVGSIMDNQLGGWYSYRASKSALNQLNKTMALEMARRKQKVACIVLHPGTCATGLSEPFQKNVLPEKLFSPERAVKQLLSIVDGVTCADSGHFFAWDGAEVPW